VGNEFIKKEIMASSKQGYVYSFNAFYGAGNIGAHLFDRKCAFLPNPSGLNGSRSQGCPKGLFKLGCS